MVITDPKIVRIWSKKGATSPFVMVLSAVYQQFIINSSSVHRQFITSSSSVHHQFIVSSPSVHCQFIISSSSVHRQISRRREGQWPKADSQKHKLDDQQIQLISPIMLPIMFPLFKSFHVVNYNQLCS